MNNFCLTNERELCWDFDKVQKNDGVSLRLHKPERKGVVLTCDKEWEGNVCGYMSLVKERDLSRLFYRGANLHPTDNTSNKTAICVLESRDGKSFKRSDISLCEYNGIKENNIVYDKPAEGKKYIDNFSVYYDENPNCPPDAKYKALGLHEYFLEDGTKKTGLMYYKSADGNSFEKVGFLGVRGAFDSLNTVLWDDKTEQYFMFYRNFHKHPEISQERIRDIRVATSKDFSNWTDHGMINFGEGVEDIQLYINNVVKYPRAKNMFIGMPVRYYERPNDRASLEDMPFIDFPCTRAELIEKEGRTGMAVTDCILMTSRDGYNFHRCDEVFLSPGVETGRNWIYGDCYTARGMIETESDLEGYPNEISFFTTEGYRHLAPINIVRYAVRLDGFFSWHADYAGGEVMTEAFVLDAEKLSLNFETSALGHVQVTVCDEQGEAICGYSSERMFGNSVDRTVRFEKPLCDLAGKTVRLKINMKDSELYSFIFEK